MNTKVIAIAAVDKNWAAGYKGQLIINNPDDLKRFSELTSGQTVVMGRKTFESLPHSCPLPNRTNVILTQDTMFNPPNCVVLRSIEKLKEYIDGSNESVIWIIGGEEIWNETLSIIDECQITSHNIESDKADTYFPNLDQLEDWTITSIEGPYSTEDAIDYEYRTYRKVL